MTEQTTIKRIVEIESPFLCPYHSRVGSIYVCQHKDVKKDGYLKTCEKQDSKNPFPNDCPLKEYRETIINKPSVNVSEFLNTLPDNVIRNPPVTNIGNRHSWSEEEDAVLCSSPIRAEAIENYRKEYPLSDRTNCALEKRYARAMRQLKKNNPDKWNLIHAEKPIEEKPITEFQMTDNRNEWSKIEINCIKTARNASEAVARYERHFYAHRFQHKRDAKEVSAKWIELYKYNEIIRECDMCQIESVSGFQGKRGTVISISEDGLSVILQINDTSGCYTLQVGVADISRVMTA